MNVVDRDQNSGCDNDHAAESGQQPVLHERKVGTECCDLAPKVGTDPGDLIPQLGSERGDLGTQRRFGGPQIRLRRDILVDRIENFCADMLRGVAADAAFLEGARQSKPIGHLSPG
jgi:hypothetical protein